MIPRLNAVLGIIRMEDHARLGVAGGDRVGQRVRDEFGAQVISQREPDHAAGGDIDDRGHSVESGLSLLSVFVLPRTDDRQMTLSLGQAQSSNEEEGGARKRLVFPLSVVAGSRSVA